MTDSLPLTQWLRDAGNGGSTQTRLPGSGSGVIGAGDPACCSTFDQRGYVRPIGATCDAGSAQTAAIDDEISRNGFGP